MACCDISLPENIQRGGQNEVAYRARKAPVTHRVPCFGYPETSRSALNVKYGGMSRLAWGINTVRNYSKADDEHYVCTACKGHYPSLVRVSGRAAHCSVSVSIKHLHAADSEKITLIHQPSLVKAVGQNKTVLTLWGRLVLSPPPRVLHRHSVQ